MSEKPLALDAYNALAESYAAVVDTKPHNAYYERPATLSLLPDVKGLKVLDAGCGPGVYSEWLIENGADVVGIDASSEMVRLAKKRLVLKHGGNFVISIHHPFFDFQYFKTENYFAIEQVGAEWKGFGETRVFMPSIRRPLEEVLNPLIEAGFRIDRILEPKASEKLAEVDPRHYEELSRQPVFMCVRALKT